MLMFAGRLAVVGRNLMVMIPVARRTIINLVVRASAAVRLGTVEQVAITATRRIVRRGSERVIRILLRLGMSWESRGY